MKTPSNVFVNQALIHVMLVISAVMSGSWSVFASISMNHMHSITFASLRAILYTIVLLPVMIIADRSFVFPNNFKNSPVPFITNRLPSKRGTGLFVLCGLFLSLNQLSFTGGLAITSPNTAALFGPVNVVAISIGSILVKHEQITKLKALGITIAVVGAFGTALFEILTKGTDVQDKPFNSLSLLGYILLTINVICNSAYVNLQTTIMIRDHVPTLTVSFWCYLYSTIFTTAVASFYWTSINLDTITWEAWYGVVYAATMGASIPWTINAYGTKLLKPTARAVHGAMAPVYTAIFSYLLLGDIIGWYMAVGALVISSGVVCVGLSKSMETAKKELRKEVTMKEVMMQDSTEFVDEVEKV
ncbi:hypothetical protein AKO1_014825 [Acrasis kona]|uniref:EamA domain-containing protein n=1 Tax=Acrasis kona TaxID=1008807 RepID=A0AAW2Z1N1_9EUKA